MNTSFDLDSAVIDLTNKYRLEHNLATLQTNDFLSLTAIAYATDMATNDFISHTGSNGLSFYERMTYVCPEINKHWTIIGENLASGFTTPKSVFQGWMNSPGHRANILNKGFSEIGVAHVQMQKSSSGLETIYWVQHFGGQNKNYKSIFPMITLVTRRDLHS